MNNPSHRASVLAGFALAVVALVAACSSSSTPSPSSAGGGGSPAASSAGGGGAVTIKGFAFDPTSITVPAGTTVTWTNMDGTAHTVTADDKSFDSKNVASNATFSQAFAKAGTFAYHCSIHPTMKATVVVQ